MVKCDIRNVRKGMDGESRFCDRFNEYIRANNLSKQVVLLQNVKAPYYGNYSDGVTKHNQIDALILTVKGIFIVEIKKIMLLEMLIIQCLKLIMLVGYV